MARMSESSPATDATTPVTVPPVIPLAPPPPSAPALTPAQAAAALRLKVRVWSTFTFAICALMLGLGLYMHPDKRGVETHTQIGLLPCGWYKATGIPCPTCGCTTAVTYFAHGNWGMSFYTQPFGFTVGLVAAMLIPLTSVGMITGRWLGPSSFWLSWHWRMWVYGGILLLVAAWVYKIWLVKSGLSGA
jgi:hypothetical protein